MSSVVFGGLSSRLCCRGKVYGQLFLDRSTDSYHNISVTWGESLLALRALDDVI